jgi:hypothetical protein
VTRRCSTLTGLAVPDDMGEVEKVVDLESR